MYIIITSVFDTSIYILPSEKIPVKTVDYMVLEGN